MSNNAMSNEPVLDWLARNVHFWDESAYAAMCGGVERVMWVSDHAYGQMSEFKNAVTKDQWLARRAELQNKPSWKDAPEWASSLTQSSAGTWVFFETEVSTNTCGGWGNNRGRHFVVASGEVLGDWRNTLERRPADLSEPAVTERLDDATKTVLAAVPGLMDEKYSFEPEFMPVSVSNETVQLERPIAVAGTGNGSAAESAFLIGRVIDLLRTSADHFSAEELAELHQLCDAELTKRDAAVCGGQKYIDAHWFERGELPPVGSNVTIVEIDGLGISDLGREFIGDECKVMATFVRPAVFLGDEAKIVAVMEPAGGCCCFRLEMVKPICTEHEQLTSIIDGGKRVLAAPEAIADAILAAGFSLRAK